jgi:hypothetical protein
MGAYTLVKHTGKRHISFEVKAAYQKCTTLDLKAIFEPKTLSSEVRRK